MYTGNNPIAIQSQKMITDALLLLMERKQFSKIQVKNFVNVLKYQGKHSILYMIIRNKF